MNNITGNGIDYASLTGELRHKLRRTHGHMIMQGTLGAPSLHLLVVTFNRGHNPPSAEPAGKDFNASLLKFAADTLDMGEDFVYDVCDSLSAHQDAGGAGTMLPFAMSAIDYPGTEEGWPRASEPPRFNAVVLVPAPLKQGFEKFATGGFSNFGPSRWSSRLQSLEVQDIEYSESGVELAVAHVLKFSKTLPWKLFGDAASICFTNYPFNGRGELVSQPW